MVDKLPTSTGESRISSRSCLCWKGSTKVEAQALNWLVLSKHLGSFSQADHEDGNEEGPKSTPKY